MALTIQALNFEGGSIGVNFNKDPDICPFCHKSITPRRYQAYIKTNFLEIVFRCPNDNCARLFLSHYQKQSNNVFTHQSCTIGTFVKRDFSENIKTLSNNFAEIYNQALESENLNLYHISGIGYRKALEFLIKDYLISKFPIQEDEKKDKSFVKKRESIKQKFLGKCIDEDIENPNLKAMAKRATWLGNDETHYVRKWESKDIEDLKKLIEVSLHWIEMELLTEQYNSEMN